ncbi:MAG: bifunctional oligoribonuclease/PAP phosphatase NrnA [Phycisphaerales bacterium JB063]
MADYISNLDLPQAAALLKDESGSICVLTHAKPDGDAAGSVVALVTALRALGKDARGLLVEPILPSLEPLARTPGIDIYDIERTLPAADRMVIVDTGAWSQVGPLASLVKPRARQTLILDHHLAGDIDAGYKFIDSTAAAAAEIIADLIPLLIDPATLSAPAKHTINEALFTGIASDTGWFKFSNATPRTLRLAAQLIEDGVDHAELYGRLEQCERVEKLALLIRAVGSLQLLADGRAAVMTLRSADFDETGALPEETERLIDIPQQVGTIQVIALISEVATPEGVQTRMSFRSKHAPDAVNVSELAGQFGGGGHARAAGARLNEPADAVVPRVVEAVTRAVQVQSA